MSEAPMSSKRFRSLLPFHSVEEVPKAKAVINRCRETVQNSTQFWSSARSKYFLNRHKCDLLFQRVIAADSTLAAIQQSPLLIESTIPVLQELHQFLRDADTLMRRSYITGTNSEWLGAAMEQGDLKETFSHLLYDIQWCTSVLQCILLEKSKEPSVKFDPTSCDCRLSASDEMALVIAMKADEEELRDRLRATLKQLDGTKPEGKFAEKLLAKLEAYSPDLVFLNPEDLDLEGQEIGRGTFGVVRKSKFLDRECVVKSLEHVSSSSIEKEMEAIRKLGNHPHIVRHFCYSKTDPEYEVYLVMEFLEMDLERALRRIKPSLQLMEAVSLMLQIGEGIKYMHGKGVAHRDLKPGNVLVNFEKFEGCSRIRSVKLADFGSTKAAERTQTNTMNTGTTKYMAPEVMKAEGDPGRVRLNLLKADVYSFAMMFIHILTGKYPYEFSNQEIKERSKAGERPLLRHGLPNCPLRLATLLTKCWSRDPNERPLFPEICRELRYIKGLLLKGDEQKLQTQVPGPGFQNLLGSVKLQGPWGDAHAGTEFFDMAASIRSIELGYSERDGPENYFRVTYEILDKTVSRESYLLFEPPTSPDHIGVTIKFQPEIEYIKQISGFVDGQTTYLQDGTRIFNKFVSSLTIHTNLQIYGPFGHETGTKFTSDTGSRVIGFHGRAGNSFCSLGVITVPDVWHS